MKRVIVLMMILFTGYAQAEIYKCGAVFSDKPCSDKAQKLDIKSTKSNDTSESAKLLRAISNKKVMLGMTKDMVKRAWGEPDKINDGINSMGSWEQWVYRIGSDTQYVHFNNGKVVGAQ